MSIEWFSALVLNYPLFKYIIIFLGVAFLGELALFTAGFLAAQGVISLSILAILSFFGVLLADILWFLIGKTTTAEKIISHRYTYATISIILQALDRISGGNRFFAVILAKFVIGTRIVLILYVSKTNLEFKRFVRYDIVAVFLWLLIVIGIGYISGLGFSYISSILRNVYAGIGFVILILLIVIIAQIWIKRAFIEKEKDILEEKNL